MRLKIGDKVITTKSYDRCPIGLVGIIVDDKTPFSVQFDDFDGHDCNGLLDNNNGYFIKDTCLKLYGEDYIEKTKNWK